MCQPLLIYIKPQRCPAASQFGRAEAHAMQRLDWLTIGWFVWTAFLAAAFGYVIFIS
jgi:hypothetical protein